MKKCLLLLLVFYVNQSKGQLRVEQLTNDSLIKTFIVQQTGMKYNEIYFLTGKELRDENFKDTPGFELDSIVHINCFITDFNNDGKKDILLSYAIKKPSKKYFNGFYIYAFVSNAYNLYKGINIWGEYEYTLGYIIKRFPESDSFILSRHEYGEGKIKFDTLKYFQGEFININENCNRGFLKLQFYTSSSWRPNPNRYITIFPDMSLFKEEYELDGNATFKGIVKKSFFDSLMNLICEVNPELLDSNYVMPNIMDAGRFHLRIQYGNKIKKINDYGSFGNFGLGALYKMLWRINKEAEWILLTENRKDNYRLKRMPGQN